MGYTSQGVYVGTAPVAILPTSGYGVTLQNLGTVSLTVGGSGVVVGQGLVLPSGGVPVPVPSHPVGGSGVDQSLWCVAPGTAGGSIGWLQVTS